LKFVYLEYYFQEPRKSAYKKKKKIDCIFYWYYINKGFTVKNNSKFICYLKKYMEKYLVYWKGFYLGNWKIGVLEIISWEYVPAPPEIGSNLRHWLLQYLKKGALITERA
jgi:hypothetical protein